MSVRSLIFVFALVAATLAGCISQDDNPVPDAADEQTMVEPTAAKMLRYLGDGSDAVEPDTFATPVWINTDFNGAEPNMGITSSGAVFASAGSTLIRSLDKGESFEAVQQHLLLNNDPMMWVDTFTDKVYHAPMFPTLACSQIYKSADDGDTWNTVPHPACGRNVFDHQKLASGPFGPDANPLPFPRTADAAMYVCYNAVVTTECIVSYDDGETWPYHAVAVRNWPGGAVGTQADGSSGCGSGQNGHPTVREDGVVAFGKTSGCPRPYLVVSTDSGYSWDLMPGPDDVGSGMLDPEVVFTPDGNTYLLYRGTDQLVYLLRTPDLGETWFGPWKVSPPGVQSTVFGAMGAGDDGRLSIAFLGTEDSDAPSSTSPDDAFWHLWMVTTDDADQETPTFTAYQVTPDDDPVQIGCIWLGGGANACRNLLDFIDGAVAPDGTFYVVYSDGCLEGCATNDESRARKISFGRLDGFSVFSDAMTAVEAIVDQVDDNTR